MPKEAYRLIDEIMEKNHTDDEWILLENTVNSYLRNAPDEIEELFIESGAGDMLSMICSGIRWEKGEQE